MADIKIDEEIEITSSKKCELLDIFKKYTIEEHTCKEEEYSYLADEDELIVIKNPNSKNDINIEISDEFTLFFADWHGHFDPYEEDYHEMIQIILDILSGKLCSVAAYTKNNWLGSSLLEKEIDITSNQTQLLEMLLRDSEPIEKIYEKGGRLIVDYWDNAYLFEFESNNRLKQSYTFPKRQNTRFVVKENKVIGSAGFKKYDEEMACLNYICIDVKDEELYTQLLKKIEEDVQNNGFKSIIAAIKNNEKSFYNKHGYYEELMINEDRLIELLGCHIDYDVILIKRFNESM